VSITTKTWGAALLVGLLAVVFLYSDILRAPSEHIFTSSGDGMKSYYSFLYHIKHDSTYAHFEGMNYPYGDLFQFTDGNLPLANTLKFLGNSEPERSALAIYNLSVIFSLALGVLLLSLIFIKLGITGWVNVLFSLAIMLMNPQLIRLTGHLTLAYSWVIPAYILFYLNYRTARHSVRNGLLLVLMTFILLWVHPYLAIIPSGLILIALGFDMLYALKRKEAKEKTIIAMLASILPIVLYMGWIKAMDTASGRSTRPFGFFEYRAEIETVFAPHSGPLYKFFVSVLNWTGTPLPMQTWEGFAYLGFAVMVILAFIIMRRVQGKMLNIPAPMLALSLSAFALLIFSFCLPFRFGHFFNTISNNLDFIRQFRAVGRFAWPFYFVMNILAFYYLAKVSMTSKRRWVKVLPFIAVLLVAIESADENLRVREMISETPNPFISKASEADYKVLPRDYQAIMTLPYFLIGPEYYIKEGDDDLNGKSMLLSYETGLPLMSSMMSRTPVPIALKQTALYELNLIEKAIAKDYTSELPFLVLADPTLCSTDELSILKKAKKVGVYRGSMVYELKKKGLFASEREELLERFSTAYVDRGDGLYFQDSTAFVLSNSFEEGEELVHIFEGKRSLKGVQNNFTEVLSPDETEFELGQEYEFSFWMYGDLNSAPGTLIIIEKDPNTGNENWSNMLGLLRFVNTRGNWHRISLKFTRQNSSPFRFVIQRPFYCDEIMVIDKCLIRPVNEEVFEVINGKLWWNNIPLDVDVSTLKDTSSLISN
jgi:hypothetical protein